MLNILMLMEKKPITIPTPKQIYEYLNQYVIGQDEAKKTLSVAVYNHYKRFLMNKFGVSTNKNLEEVSIEKSNILLLGETGTGKTFLLKNIANLIGVPCYIADCTSITESGYVGDDVENVLVGLLRESDYNIDAAEMGIVILDEVDKIATKSDNPSITRDVSGEGVQQGLLKIVEGGKVSVPPQGGRKHPHQECIEIDTTNILFVALGAFAGINKTILRKYNINSVGYNNLNNKKTDVNEKNYLDYVETDDLRKFGLIPEFLGRFPVITHTNPLSEEDLIKILSEPKNAIIKQYQKLLDLDNINLKFENDALKIIAHMAIKNKTGARGLRKIIEKILNNIMFEYGGNIKKKTIKINTDFIKNILNLENEIFVNVA